MDVCVTFETMNNRGKKLSNLELLKNRLIYLSTLFNSGEDIKNRLRRDINDCWKDIYHLLGKNRNERLKDDDFLYAHYCIYFESILKKTDKGSRKCKDFLLKEYFVPEEIINNRLEPTNIFDYVTDLKEGIKSWYYLSNPTDSPYNKETKEYLRKINYIVSENIDQRSFHVPNIDVFLFTCFKQTNGKEFLALLKILEKYLFLTLFYPDGTFLYRYLNPIFDTNQKVTEIVGLGQGRIPRLRLSNEKTNVSEIIQIINIVIKEMQSSEERKRNTIEYYNKRGFYQQLFLKYFLAEYEIFLSKQSRNYEEKLNRDKYFKKDLDSIEHILPMNIGNNKYWQERFGSSKFSQYKRKALQNSLGNLVIITVEKNDKMKNRSFPEKKGANSNSIGFRYGNYSEIQISAYEDWTEKEIKDRGMNLITFLKRRWGIVIGDGTKSDKLMFLGLEFLKEREND